MIALPQAKRVRAIEKIAASIVRAKTQEKGENVLAAAVRAVALLHSPFKARLGPFFDQAQA